jgi:DNA-binding MarR family transcriptional regulator
MVIRHHSAVELVDRAARAGLLTRGRDPDRLTVVRLALTPHGERTLASLSEIHLRELAELAPQMSALWDAVGDVARTA